MEGYDLVAADYDKWYWRKFWRRNELPIVLHHLGAAPPNPVILDVGCATGEYTAVFERIGIPVGVDLSIAMLRRARERLGPATPLVRASVVALPFLEATFHISVASRCLSHVRELEQAVAELGRVTIPGGTCVFSDVHATHDYRWTRIPSAGEYVYIETHKVSPEEVVAACEASGYLRVQTVATYTWSDLVWKPEDPRFESVDPSGGRPIFFVVLACRV